MIAVPKVERIVLNSWKEIAGYVGRGVRTVQRWEVDCGLPVRRPRAKSRSAVIAFSDEIDAWLRSAPTAEVLPAEAKGDVLNCQSSDNKLHERVMNALLRNRQNVLRMIQALRLLEATVIVCRTSKNSEL